MSLSALGSGEKNGGLGSHILVLPFKDLFGTSKWKAVFLGGGGGDQQRVVLGGG